MHVLDCKCPASTPFYQTNSIGQWNNSTLALVHGYIPAISVDKKKNAMLANQSSNSTDIQEAFGHDVTVPCYDWFTIFEYTVEYRNTEIWRNSVMADQSRRF